PVAPAAVNHPTLLSKRHYRKPQPRGHLPTSCRNILNIYRYVERSQRSRVVDPLQPEEWTRTRQASDIRPHGYGRGPERPTGLRSSSHPNASRPNIHSEHNREQRNPSLPLAPQGSVHRDCQQPIANDQEHYRPVPELQQQHPAQPCTPIMGHPVSRLDPPRYSRWRSIGIRRVLQDQASIPRGTLRVLGQTNFRRLQGRRQRSYRRRYWIRQVDVL